MNPKLSALLLLIFIVLPRFIFSLGLMNLERTRLQAKAISRQLHNTLENNVAIHQLEKLYESAECTQRNAEYPHELIQQIVFAVESRLNGMVDALKNTKASIESGSHASTRTITAALEDCCNVLPVSVTEYNPRFRTQLNATAACETIHASDPTGIEGKESLLETFRENLLKSPMLTWQYYGSSQGHYLQFPAKARQCNESAKYDPRFKSWYVEAASHVRTNIIIIIDRSLSMRTRNRIKLARQAAITVLDTLGPDDNVGVLAFSNEVITHSGCFGHIAAQAIPTNVKQLRNWVEKLVPGGSTKYVPAIRGAFQMLAGISQDEDSTSSNATNIILFLTDGDPYDSNQDIYRAIQQGQNSLASRARINTYGLGHSLSGSSIYRLQQIADQNNGTFTQILDRDSSNLRSIMGQYYTGIAGTLRDQPGISVPHLDTDLGLIITLSVACRGNDSVVGVVAVDAPIDELLKEVVQFSMGRLSYAVLIDNKGRTIVHPNVPQPTEHVTEPVFQPLSLYEPRLSSKTLKTIRSGIPGSIEMQTSMPLSRGDPRADGVQTIITNATYMWQPVRGGTYVIILVIGDRNLDLVTIQKFTGSFPASRSHYHRLDLTWNNTMHHPPPVCNMDGDLVSLQSSTVKIAPEAFNNSAKYIYTPETFQAVESIERFFNDQTHKVKYTDLTNSARVDVMLTSQLDLPWNASQQRDPDMVQWRYVGTERGVFRVFPGIRMHKTYSHKRQPWYRRAVTNAGRLTVSRGALNASLNRPVAMVSLAKTIRSGRCGASNSKIDPISGVIGMDITTGSFKKLLNNMPEMCDPATYNCYIMDDSGFLVLDKISSPTPGVGFRHVTQVFPWLAATLASEQGLLQAAWCNNLEVHKIQLFYTMSLSLNLTSSAPGTEPCRQFVLSPVPDTNVYLLVIHARERSGCNETHVPTCRCQTTCSNCTGHVMPCQCPCSCSMRYDECSNSVTGLWTGTLCPVSLPETFDTSVGKVRNADALRRVPICPKPCQTATSENQCNATSSCHWCRYSSSPSCNSICRTNTRVTITVLFPCNDFLELSLSQQEEVTKACKKALLDKMPQLNVRILGNVVITKAGIILTLHGTTDGIPVVRFRDKIQSLIQSGAFTIGPTTNVTRLYAAASSKYLTNLHVQLILPSDQLSSLSDSQREEFTGNLQTVIDSLLGESPASQLHDVRIYKESVLFFLSNQGKTSTFPISMTDSALSQAVTQRRLRLQLPSDRENTTARRWVSVLNISTTATFDYFCHSPTPTTSQQASSLSTTDSKASLTDSDNATFPHPSPTEFNPVATKSLIPIEVFIVIFTALAISACCPVVMFFAYRRRNTNKCRISPDPETEIEEDFATDVSQLTERISPLPDIDDTQRSPIGYQFAKSQSTRVSIAVEPMWSENQDQGRGPTRGDTQTNRSQKCLKGKTSQPHVLQSSASGYQGIGIFNQSENQGTPADSSSFPGKYIRKASVREMTVKATKPNDYRRRDNETTRGSFSYSGYTNQRITGISNNTYNCGLDESRVGNSFSHNKMLNQARDFEGVQRPSQVAVNTRRQRVTEVNNNTSNATAMSPPRDSFLNQPGDKTVAAPARGLTGKYRRSQSTRDFSMATFRIPGSTARRLSRSAKMSGLNSGLVRRTIQEHGSRSIGQEVSEVDECDDNAPVTKPRQAWANGRRASLVARRMSTTNL